MLLRAFKNFFVKIVPPDDILIEIASLTNLLSFF